MAKDHNDGDTQDWLADAQTKNAEAAATKDAAAAPLTGAALAAKRRIHQKACEVCGNYFSGIAKRLTCSDACRKRKSRR